MEEWIEYKRHRGSKKKRLHIDSQPTNKFSVDATIGPMHYKDAGDEWQDIDTELLPSTQSIVGFGNPAFEMVENEYEMFILGALNSGVPLVRYVSKNTGYWVQFAAHNLVWTNDLDQIDFIATPVSTATEIAGSEARWPDAYGAGLDLRYIAGRGRMAKWLDIDSPLPDPPQFIIDGGNPVIEFAEILEFHNNLDVYINGEEWNKKDDVSTAAEIEFRSPDGQVQFVFPVAIGYYDDTSEEERRTDTVGQLHLKKQGNKLYATARFPYSWLQSATYPVHLDTDIDPQPAVVGTSSDDALGYNASTALTGASITLLADSWWGGFRWTGVGVPPSDIDVCYCEFYLPDASDSTDDGKELYFENASNPSTFTTAGGDITGRDRTSAKGVMDDSYPGGVGWYTVDHCPSLVDPLQEVVDDQGGTGDAVVLIIDSTTTADLDIQAWDGDTEKTAKLHIEYTATAAGIPQQMMHYMRMRRE